MVIGGVLKPDEITATAFRVGATPVRRVAHEARPDGDRVARRREVNVADLVLSNVRASRTARRAADV